LNLKPREETFTNFSACGGEFTESTGIVASPYFPNPYPSNRRCNYLISQPPGTIITLRFEAFDIEGSYNCFYDYLVKLFFLNLIIKMRSKNCDLNVEKIEKVYCVEISI